MPLTKTKITRLGYAGFPRQVNGSFAGKTPAGPSSGTAWPLVDGGLVDRGLVDAGVVN